MGHSGTTTTETILLWRLSSDYRGPGAALTGSAAAIDEAEHVFSAAHGADKVQVGHSVELAGRGHRLLITLTGSCLADTIFTARSVPADRILVAMVAVGEGPELGDAFGRALSDRQTGQPGAIVIERDDGFIEVDSGDYLGGWSDRDTWALQRAPGRVLDMGAGAGRASLALQERGQDVVALDVSPGAVGVCRRRGVKEVFLGTVAELAAAGGAPFDSVLMLGNNLGLLGSPERAPGSPGGARRSPSPRRRHCRRVHRSLSDRQARAPRLPRVQPACRADARPGHDQGPVSAAGHGVV